MARDYVNEMNRLIAADNLREAGRVTATFQTKVVKSLEGTLASSDGAELARAKLAIYTASRTVYDDVTKMLCVLRARDALAKFSDALPASIRKFDDPQVTKYRDCWTRSEENKPTRCPSRWRWWRHGSRLPGN